MRVLAKTGAMVRSCAMMYKAVAQSLLLYGSERWVVTGDMLKVLEVLHYQSARQITGMAVTCRVGREWEYPLVVVAI